MLEQVLVLLLLLRARAAAGACFDRLPHAVLSRSPVPEHEAGREFVWAHTQRVLAAGKSVQ